MKNSKLAEIIAKACADESYKQALIANPNQVLTAAGVDVSGLDIKVLADTDKVKHLVIPNVSGKGVTGGALICNHHGTCGWAARS